MNNNKKCKIPLNKNIGNVDERMIKAKKNVERRAHAEKRQEALCLPKIVEIRNPIAQILDVETMNEDANPNIPRKSVILTDL